MRRALSLYAFDRPALIAFSGELRRALLEDDRAAIVALLGLGEQLAARFSSAQRGIDWFLRPETNSDAQPFYASLRRVAKSRALTLAWTSSAASLEGRLRQYDVVRDEPELAKLVDQLLDPGRLPWFLCRPGATGGWLTDERRAELANGLAALADALPDEITAFATALADVDGAVIAHDML
jgi:hypothetical protein